MKQFIITLSFIVLAVLLVNTFILGDSGSMKSEAENLGENMIDELNSLNFVNE